MFECRTRETPLQQAVLQWLDAIPGSPPQLSVELWSALFSQLISCFRSADTAEGAGGGATIIVPASVSFARNALRVLIALYKLAPKEVAAVHFEPIAIVLRDVLLLTASQFHTASELCREAVSAFIAIVERGLPAINTSSAIDDGILIRVWTLLADTISAFVAERRQSLAVPTDSKSQSARPAKA